MASRREELVTEPASASESGPILLFGMPRSGTTWIGKLFDSHPDTLYRHEPDSQRDFVMPRYPKPEEAPQYAQALREFIAGLPDINAQRVAGKRPLFAKSYLSRTRSLMMGVGVRLAVAGNRVYDNFPVLMYRSGSGSPRRRIVWKSIQSLARLGLILEAIDNARAIQILRHPCGYIASVQRGLDSQQFSDNISSSEDYGIFSAVSGTPLADRYELSKSTLRSLSPEERLAWRWVCINEKALLESEGSGRRLCIRYEDICRDPQAGVQRMFDFAGLAMNPQTRAFIDASTRQGRRGYYSVFKDPFVAAWQWRDELDARTIERVMAIVRRTRMGAYYSGDDMPRPGGP